MHAENMGGLSFFGHLLTHGAFVCLIAIVLCLFRVLALLPLYSSQIVRACVSCFSRLRAMRYRYRAHLLSLVRLAKAATS
jgi:hypothetical protein